jgi:predicted nucleic acid-binding protein
LTLERAGLAIDAVDDLAVELVPPDRAQDAAAVEWARRLQQRRAYDGFYLAVAEARGTELWTGDRRLVNGARSLGVEWIRHITEIADAAGQ